MMCCAVVVSLLVKVNFDNMANASAYLRTSFDVISGHTIRNPSLMALYSVDRAGFLSAVCRNDNCCAIVTLGITYIS